MDGRPAHYRRPAAGKRVPRSPRCGETAGLGKGARAGSPRPHRRAAPTCSPGATPTKAHERDAPARASLRCTPSDREPPPPLVDGLPRGAAHRAPRGCGRARRGASRRRARGQGRRARPPGLGALEAGRAQGRRRLPLQRARARADLPDDPGALGPRAPGPRSPPLARRDGAGVLRSGAPRARATHRAPEALPRTTRARSPRAARWASCLDARAWAYDWGSGTILRRARGDTPERAFELALRGLPPETDLVQALVERALDDGSLRSTHAAFGRAYTDRTGLVYPGITLYDAWKSGAEIEMPDVDCLGIVNTVLDDWTTWTSIVPGNRQAALYARIAELFQPAHRPARAARRGGRDLRARHARAVLRLRGLDRQLPRAVGGLRVDARDARWPPARTRPAGRRSSRGLGRALHARRGALPARDRAAERRSSPTASGSARRCCTCSMNTAPSRGCAKRRERRTRTGRRATAREGPPMNVKELEKTARALVAPGKGILAADESTRHDQEALRRDRGRVDRGEPARLPRAALHDRGHRGVHRRRDPLRRDDPPAEPHDGTPFAGAARAKGVVPGIKVDTGAKPLRRRPGRDGHRGPRRPAQAARRVLRARRAIRQVARA